MQRASQLKAKVPAKVNPDAHLGASEDRLTFNLMEFEITDDSKLIRVAGMKDEDFVNEWLRRSDAVI